MEPIVHTLIAVAILAGFAFAQTSHDRLADLLVAVVAASVLLPFLLAPLVFPGESGTFATMRLAAGFAFLHVPLAFGLAAAAPSLGCVPRILAGFVALALVGVGIDAFFVEPTALEVRFETIRSPRIRTRTRLVVLADLQTDAITDHERAVFARTAALHPDLVLLPGDYVQRERDPGYVRVARELGRRIDALGPRLGTHAVRGNVEADSWQADVFGATRVATYETRTRVDLGELTITALSFEDSFDPTMRIERPDDDFHVVFGHAPDFALGDVHADLLVAGHTHGGQVSLPFFGPPITFSTVPRPWAAGGHRILSGGRHLDVSRGIGMERLAAPRLRFLCHPEIVVIDLLPSDG